MWSNADPKTKLMEIIENTFLKSHKGQELGFVHRLRCFATQKWRQISMQAHS